ncbi:LIM domain-containing protein A isoform X1 [Kryptolebias marmoratus]|uniref:LIM domain-containing protein A isoform X1 n=1 Tax=Kryptolebias marmoratus TaxID=37003 RepID=UPI0007F8D257|nr:LIM domain-containing protein A isoform X1 [Kryptolebias marmoratus]
MCDHQEKGHKLEKTPNSKTQQVMQPHHHQGHRHHHCHHQADDNNHDNIHSAEDIKDRQPNHQNQRDYEKLHHHHPHHCHHKQNHRHVSQSTKSSSLSSSSSTSTSSSSSSSSSSLSSSSFSSSSLLSSSTTSSSSSTLSSKNSSECSERYHPRRPQHSQSFTDVSGKHKYFEEDDDTTPLINARGNLNRSSAKQKRDVGKSSPSSFTKEDVKKSQTSTRHLGKDGSFRKAKSMDDLTRPKDKKGIGNENENEEERSKSEARQNLLKEKMKFSAFLNEITRQVLSPMRLSSLGVTDPQRPHSPGQASGKSREKDSNTDKPKQWRSQPTSPDSTRSSKHSHSPRLSRSKSFHHHGHHSASPPSHMKHRPTSCHSWSPNPEHHPHSPTPKFNHHHHQEEFNSLSHHHQHRNHHHHHQGHHHNSAYQQRDHHSPIYHNTSHLHKDKRHKDHYSPTHHYKHHSASHCHDHHAHSHEDHHGTHHGHHEHAHNLRDNYDPSRHHEDHLFIPHHHDDHHSSGHHANTHSTSCPTTPCHCDHQSPTSNHGTHQGLSHQHHHGDHHRDTHPHHPVDHRNGPHHPNHESHHSLGHHQPHNEAHGHHYEDHHKEANRHHHRDHHSPSYWHPPQHHHNKLQHHLENHHSPGHTHLHGEHKSEHYHHHHGDQHNEACHHRHRDHHSKPHQQGDQQSEGQHQHRDLHSPVHHHHHHHHHGNQHRETHHHHHGDHHSLGHHYRNKAYQHNQGDQPNEVYHLHQEDQHNEAPHYGNHYSQGHDCCHGDYNNTSHCQGQHLESQSHLKHCKTTNHDKNRLDDVPTQLMEHAANNPPSHRKPESVVSKNSTSNTNNPSTQEKEHTSFTGQSTHEEKTPELGRIRNVQDQNEGLHQSLLKTAVRMECLGEEFISSQKLLEIELQRTRMELSSLMERFKRLQDDCSSTQQTNNFLEQKLHSMLQNMEGERERLNRRISELTEQLTDASIANTMEAINVTSVLHKTTLHSPDDALIQMVPPITPPPAQFMDIHNYEKDKSSGQEQPLGSVPEEEESDWSEVGEETPRLVLTGSSRSQTWRHHEADMDKDSESGSEEIVRRHFSRPLQIPHLQFTIHNEFLPPAHTNSCPSGFKNLSDNIPGDIEEIYMTTTSPNIKSAILIRSASLEDIPLTRHHMQKELRGTEAMMNLHHSEDEAMEDLDNEIIHHWRMSSDRDTVIRRLTKSGGAEADGSMAGLQSAERVLNPFRCDPPASEGEDLGRAELRGWAGGIPGEVLNVERTQL